MQTGSIIFRKRLHKYGWLWIHKPCGLPSKSDISHTPMPLLTSRPGARQCSEVASHMASNTFRIEKLLHGNQCDHCIAKRTIIRNEAIPSKLKYRNWRLSCGFRGHMFCHSTGMWFLTSEIHTADHFSDLFTKGRMFIKQTNGCWPDNLHPKSVPKEFKAYVLSNDTAKDRKCITGHTCIRFQHPARDHKDRSS